MNIHSSLVVRLVALSLLLAGLATTTAMAQRTCVVADMETHVPIREAIISTNNGHWARTDYRGYWAMKYAFDSAHVSKAGYITYTVQRATLPDTIFLLPEAKQIDEVEVWGQNRPTTTIMGEEARGAARNAPRQGGIQGDFLGWMDRRAVRDKKHLSKAKEVGKELDKESDDPIEDAYLQIKKRERLEQERQANEKERREKTIAEAKEAAERERIEAAKKKIENTD